MLCRRFAYVEFGSENEAENAMKELTGKKLGDRKLVFDFVGAKKTKSDDDCDPYVLFGNCFISKSAAVRPG